MRLAREPATVVYWLNTYGCSAADCCAYVM